METEQLAAMTLCSLADLQQSRMEDFCNTHQLDARSKEDFVKVVKWFLNGKIPLLELVEKLIMIIGWKSAQQLTEFLRKELGIAITDEVQIFLDTQKPSDPSAPSKFILYAVEMSLAKEKLPKPTTPKTTKRTTPATSTQKTTKDDSQPPRKRAKKVEWSVQEDELLKSLITKYPKEKYSNKWSLIADHFPGKTEGQCYEHWHRVLDPSIKKGPWDPEEEAKLEDLVKRMNGKVRWAQIASQMGGRIDTACRYYYSQMIKSRESPWSAPEDAELVKAVKEVKDTNNAVEWVTLSQNLRQRIGKSKLPVRSALDCKLRYATLNKENKAEPVNEAKVTASTDNNNNNAKHDTPADSNKKEDSKPNLQVDLLNRESEIEYDTGSEE